MSSARQQFELLLDFLLSVEGIVGLLAGLVIALLGIQRPLIAWWLLTLGTLTASLSLPFVADGEEILPLAPGLNQLRAYGRVISLAVLMGVTPFVVLSPLKTWRTFSPRALNWWFLAVQAVLVLKYFEYRLTAYAALSAVVYAMMLVVFGLGHAKFVPTLTPPLDFK